MLFKQFVHPGVDSQALHYTIVFREESQVPVEREQTDKSTGAIQILVEHY